MLLRVLLTKAEMTINLQKNINPKKYILTFKAKGVSIFATDIHKDVYSHMKVLFTIRTGEFKQYFPLINYEQALNRGLVFYKNNYHVDNYIKKLKTLNKNFLKFYNKSIHEQKQITPDVLRKFFRYTINLCRDYTKMNVEFTNKAFLHKDKSKDINTNLDKINAFKDEVRAFMNTVLFEKDGFTKNLFNIFAKQFRLPANLLENLTQRELLNLFEDKLPNKKIILKRQQAYVSIWDKESPIEGKNAKFIINKFEENNISTFKIKGQIANKGKSIGYVKIIVVDYTNLVLLSKEVNKMKPGQILVSETTTPELILACNKASAIVTDLGGLMSHAAIVSRELGIPCIIGTKIATKVLKDGDLVEVDANKGVVRKL